ncbi:hypothetical protein [Acidovorax sp. CCYZU-2555]|uniref:hypothetical protein n=1 Tax=Acidovorax sp. CCYZU-2555 TaxID=2835042 RepID=UPI001BD1AB6C|nr:hypothetical protein [Acidovorax sp. CCYZU-2555]MBS7781356.1 hypothetical protein [Acidovorax sp. CCYZU-2555]
MFSLDAAGARTRAANHGAAGQCLRALAPPRARPVQRPRAGRSFDRIEQSISSYQLDDFAYKQYLQGSVHAIAAADYPLATGDLKPLPKRAPFGIMLVQKRTFTDAALHHSKESPAPRSQPPPYFHPFS